MKKFILNHKNTIIFVGGTLLSTFALILSVAAVSSYSTGNEPLVRTFILLSYFVLSINRLLLAYKSHDSNNKKRLISMASIYFLCAIACLFAGLTTVIYVITGYILLTMVIVNNVILIKSKNTRRALIYHGLIIVLFLLLTISLSISEPTRLYTYDIIVVIGLSITLLSFIDLIAFIFPETIDKSIFKILRKTYALEIIYGLIIFMIATSILLMNTEPSLASFGDALWYCFAVVTTIGFGDFTCVTTIGRIMSVILGLYGIVVVALITSIIVNLFNETRKKQDDTNYLSETGDNKKEELNQKQDNQNNQDKENN